MCVCPFPNLCPPLCFLAKLEKKVAEATSAADALKRSLDAEACEGLGVEVGASGSSLWSRIGALYSRARERLREALHVGVKKALAVVSFHHIGINLPAVSDGYVLPDDEAEAQEELQKLAHAAEAPGDALATFFDVKVELPPLGARDPG